MATEGKLVTVFGATGRQGGSVVQALLQDGKFLVRAVTRDPDSAKAQALQSSGAQLIKGDTQDAQSIAQAVQGAYAVFSVTARPAHQDETAEAKAVAHAAKQAGVQHFIWSTLSNSLKISKGKFDVPHWNQKAQVDEYVASLKFPFHTFVSAAWYFSNFSNIFARTEPDGVVGFNVPFQPSTRLPGFDVDDLGRAIPGILHDPQRWGHGAYVRFAASYMPYSEYVKTFETVTGKKAKINDVTVQQFYDRATMLPVPIRSSLMLGMQTVNEFGFYPADAEVDNASQLAHLTTFAEWLKKSGWQG